MDKFTYEGGRKLTLTYEVRLNEKYVGQIVQVPGGWQYWPDGAMHGGETFVTVNLCKQSLEVEENLCFTEKK